MANPHPKDASENLKPFQEGEDKRRQLKGRKPRYEIAKLIEERGAALLEDDPDGRTKAEAAIDAMWKLAQQGNGNAVKAFAELAKYGWGTPEVKDSRQVMLMIVAGAQQLGINPADDPILNAIFTVTGFRTPKLSPPRSTGGDSAGEAEPTSQNQDDIVDGEVVS